MDDQNPTEETKLKDVQPTQMTVGYDEVTLKRKEWRKRHADDAKDFLSTHRFPAISGPRGFYIVDHHHLGLALLEEKVDTVKVAILSDLSKLDEEEFWVVMDHRQWAHPYDEHGKRRPFTAMPTKLTHLGDDPYRSLAAAVEREGGYPKDATPFSEFLWADFFRRRIPLIKLRDKPKGALKEARKLAVKREAAHLPNWRAL